MSFSLLLSSFALGEDDVSIARSILDRYLAMPHPMVSKTDRYGSPAVTESTQAQIARTTLLAELKKTPHGGVVAAEEVLFDRATPEQREEIVSALSDYIHTSECAQLLYRVLKDIREPEGKEQWEELVRSSAVLGLRRMASRTNRSGGTRVPAGRDFEPQVQGILPYLIFATNDKSETVRISALYGLADSRDLAAVPELRRCLRDSSWKVRLYAACFLTEYQDASGLTEMCKAPSQLQTKPEVNKSFTYYGDIELILASFERIAGKGFGEIPMNPVLSSNSNAEADAFKKYQELLQSWEKWCSHQSNAR